MSLNNVCKYKSSEINTIKKCSKLNVVNIGKEIARGREGIIYPVDVIIDSEQITLILKKITRSAAKEELKELNAEIKHTYLMGNNDIGPYVYDTFYYMLDEHTICQYILMEKFDMCVGDWLLTDSELNSNDIRYKSTANCMLNILYKQIFIMEIYCGDIKVDNFVVNLNPFDIKMIDFGNDWCYYERFPDISELETIKKYSKNIKKQIFYALCALQLFVNIIKKGTPIFILKHILAPFFSDIFFVKYIIGGMIKNNPKINFKAILKDVMDNSIDQGILLEHYLKENKYAIDHDEIIRHTVKLINKMITLLQFDMSMI